MNKKEFINALGKGLAGLFCEEQDKWLDFYGEMIDDRMEEGLTEEDAVAQIGTAEVVAEQILTQSKPNKSRKKRELKTWQLILLIVGSPLWFSLLVAAASVVFSLLVVLWVVVISFYAVAVSLMACGLAGVVVAPVMLVLHGNMGAALTCLGAGLFCGGLGILWLIGTNYLAKGTAWLCKKLFAVLIPRKEAA